MFENEIDKGVALLDVRIPRWREMVIVDRLDMSVGGFYLDGDGCGCVLSQVEAFHNPREQGTYGEGLVRLEDGFTLIDGANLGFECPVGWRTRNPIWTADNRKAADEAWNQLTAEWAARLREEIEAWTSQSQPS